MDTIKCPSCGHSITVIEKKPAFSPLVGCLLALLAVPAIVAGVGMLAAIAIPSFMNARAMSQQRACYANLQDIAKVKDLLVVETGAEVGESLDPVVMDRRLEIPVCPSEGVYIFHSVGESPECTVHGILTP